MGKDSQSSVVDFDLRVHGIEGLRVVDGSVIPVGSPYLAVPEVLALAERASDLILEANMEEHQHLAMQLMEVPTIRAETVTTSALKSSLGSHFTIMEAVAYLDASFPIEGLLARPNRVPLGAPVALVGAILAAMVGGLALARHRGAAVQAEAKYALLA